jgi:hypothetical protein
MCQQHPRNPAGWRCQSCEAALCPDCAVGRRVQSVELVACGRCAGATEPLLAHRRRVPLAARLKKAWRYVFSPSGLQVVMAVSLMLSLLGGLRDMLLLPFLRVLPMALYGGIFWGTFYALVRASARGDTDLDTPEFNDLFRDAIAPSLRGLVTFTVVWLPALLYASARAPGNNLLDGFGSLLLEGLPPGLRVDPVLWALGLLGVVWLPMALMLTAAGQPLSAILNPLMALRMGKKLGRDYLLTAGALALLGGVHLVAHGLGFGLRVLNLFIISRMLSEALTLVAPFTAAHVVGLLLYVRGDSLGYGAARDYLEPVLGNTGPRLAAPPLREAGALPGPATDAAPALAGGTHEASEQLSALGAAVEARDVPRAMALYATLGQVPGVRVPPAHHLFVGQTAAVEGNFPLAVQALERAADVAPDEPTAPRALVLLARVLGERMHEVARAEEVYRYVLHRYPGTSAAAFARERVPPVASD